MGCEKPRLSKRRTRQALLESLGGRNRFYKSTVEFAGGYGNSVPSFNRRTHEVALSRLLPSVRKKMKVGGYISLGQQSSDLQQTHWGEVGTRSWSTYHECG